jgi:peptidoglycan/xylan/chitin deacetylase (PgdA/CDA1 family)
VNILNAGLRSLAPPGLVGAVLQWQRGKPLILAYHGVTAAPASTGIANIAKKHMPLATFVAQIRLLKKYRRIIGLSELVESLRDGHDLRNAVALTFDDGYENNVWHAARVLADEKVTATFFLATSYIGTDRWMWTDLLEHSLDNTCATGLPGEGAAFPLATRADKARLFQSLKERLKCLSPAERDRQVAAIAEQLLPGATLPSGDHRFMNWDQARGLVSAGFELGAHSVNHAILSRVTPEEAEAEMVGSKDAVVSETGRCCPVFCYPNGKPADYTQQVIEACRRHFMGALSTRRGTVTKELLYELPRLGTSGSADDLARVLMLGR